ncbi:hypothetical protein CDD82_7854 [Ophiocordyceps australis]|uniref:RRM domain-containing protein n=1 Tax=Ophiocordyceps australis TaxID=1399860 RepID=A0A2C5YNV6_9HYPO|nr:hypothetical protein CDD82_7854 [Ophiocordyceps australis]
MSASAPQAISRRPNGAPVASISQPREALNRAPAPLSRASAASNKMPQAKPSNEPQPQRPTVKGKGSPETTKNASTSDGASRRAKTKAAVDGAKIVIRRLPPGMTEAEFTSILPPDYALGHGKVDWFSYRPGKVSVDPSKPSRPSRAYLHVMCRDDIIPLCQIVRSATWEDARSTFTSPCLIGPPVLDFATYKRIPSTKSRFDPRQGTIDQDQEFMDFLEELANPSPSKASVHDEDADEAAKDEAKVTTTPLVEYLKEKSANKGKDHATSKGAKPSLAKGKGVAKEDDLSKKRTREAKADGKSSDPVKILTKKTPTETAAEAAKNVASQLSGSAATDAPKSRRAGIAAAARILQRDLGLSPGSAHRRARHDAAKADADTKASLSKEPMAKMGEGQALSSDATAAASSSQTPKSHAEQSVAPEPQSTGRRGRGGRAADKGKAVETPSALVMNPPVILKKKSEHQATDATLGTYPPFHDKTANGSATSGTPANPRINGGGKASSTPKKAATVTAGATRAFVKNVSSSQGVTEASLRQSLEVFGAVTSIEVDKRKNFAYVDFAQHQGFLGAVNASPVQVGQTTVQIVERKDKKPLGNGPVASPGGSDKGSSRGRRGRGGGGGGSSSKVNGVQNGVAVLSSTNDGGTG